jgi:hypothetical protein
MDTSKETPMEKFDPTLETTPSAPGTSPAPAVTPDTSDNSAGVLDTLKDAGKGVLAGAEGAVAGVRQTARGIADATGLSDLMDDRETNAQPLESKAPQPEGIAGQLTASVTQAALGYAVGGVALRAAKLPGVAGAMAQSAVGTPLVANADQERLSNTLMQFPFLAPIVSPLAQDPTDSVLTSKVKAGLEDVLATGAAASVFKGLQLLYLKAAGKGATPSAVKLEKEVAAEAATPASKDLTLDQAIPTKTIETPGQKVQGFEQVKLNDLSFKPKEHAGPINPAKTAQIGEAIQTDTSKMSPITVEKNPDGSLNIIDGRHRVEAAKAQGFDTITAKMVGQADAPTAVKPITLQTSPTGDSGVTLTPAASAKFQNIMEKLVIKDAVQGISKPTVGVGESAAKVGAPLRQEFNQSPANVLESLAQLGKLTKTELSKASPAYRSVDETKELAAIMGQDHAELLANLKASNAGLENIDAIATGARQYLQVKGAEMWATARKSTISGDPESKALFAQQFTHLSEFQAQLSEVTTRLGRGLRSFGESVGPFDPKAIAAKMNDPEQAANLARIIHATDGNVDQIAHVLKMQQLSWFQKAVGTHNEYWTGLGLLSRLATQTVNLSSTALNSLMEPAAMVVGGVERGITGSGWAEAREGVAIYSGMRTAFFDSMHMAWQAAKTEHAIISQSGTMEQPTKYISALTYNMNPANMPGKFIDLMGNITRASFRGLTAGDEFFKQLSYRAKVSATAAREAADMVKAGTLDKTGIADHVAKALQASIDEQGVARSSDALKYAEKASFVNDLKGSTWGDYTSMGEAMARLSSANPLIRGVILPFIKTPTNVTRTTFEYTPLIGQLRKQFYTDVAAGGEKQAMALGKLTIGSGMYIGAGMLALEGRITGAPPAPGVVVPAGWKPYSVRFQGIGQDGGDLFLSYQRMQPFGDILGLTADFAKSTGMLDVDTREGLAHSMSLAISKLMTADGDTLGKAALGASAAYGKSLISKTYYRNMTEFFSTFSGYNNEAALVRWFQNYTASHVPGVLSQFNSDDTVREVRSTLDAIMARIPGLSQQLPAKRDYFGNIHDTKVGFPWSIIQPLAASETKVDPVMNELNRLSVSNAQTKFDEPEHLMTIAGKKVDLKTVKNADGVTAYDRMNELMKTVKPAGKTRNFHDELDHVMSQPRYQLGKDNDTLDGSPLFVGYRTQAVKKEEGEYRKAALDAVKNEFKGPLGIESAMKDRINSQIGRKKVGAGLWDKVLELNK